MDNNMFQPNQMLMAQQPQAQLGGLGALNSNLMDMSSSMMPAMGNTTQSQIQPTFTPSEGMPYGGVGGRPFARPVTPEEYQAKQDYYAQDAINQAEMVKRMQERMGSSPLNPPLPGVLPTSTNPTVAGRNNPFFKNLPQSVLGFRLPPFPQYSSPMFGGSMPRPSTNLFPGQNYGGPNVDVRPIPPSMGLANPGAAMPQAPVVNPMFPAKSPMMDDFVPRTPRSGVPPGLSALASLFRGRRS